MQCTTHAYSACRRFPVCVAAQSCTGRSPTAAMRCNVPHSMHIQRAGGFCMRSCQISARNCSWSFMLSVIYGRYIALFAPPLYVHGHPPTPKGNWMLTHRLMPCAFGANEVRIPGCEYSSHPGIILLSFRQIKCDTIGRFSSPVCCPITKSPCEMPG